MAPILEVKNLVTRFDTLDGIVNAINGVSFSLEEGETLAVVGEMGSAVAHGLRNPLASIRSSAELALEHPLPDDAKERLILARALERRHLSLEAETLRREKKLLEDNIITMVSHQLRSPLVAMAAPSSMAAGDICAITTAALLA